MTTLGHETHSNLRGRLLHLDPQVSKNMRLGAKQILYHDICALSHDLLNCDNGGLAGDTADIRASFDPHETILAP